MLASVIAIRALVSFMSWIGFESGIDMLLLFGQRKARMVRVVNRRIARLVCFVSRLTYSHGS